MNKPLMRNPSINPREEQCCHLFEEEQCSQLSVFSIRLHWSWGSGKKLRNLQREYSYRMWTTILTCHKRCSFADLVETDPVETRQVNSGHGLRGERSGTLSWIPPWSNLRGERTGLGNPGETPLVIPTRWTKRKGIPWKPPWPGGSWRFSALMKQSFQLHVWQPWYPWTIADQVIYN